MDTYIATLQNLHVGGLRAKIATEIYTALFESGGEEVSAKDGLIAFSETRFDTVFGAISQPAALTHAGPVSGKGNESIQLWNAPPPSGFKGWYKFAKGMEDYAQYYRPGIFVQVVYIKPPADQGGAAGPPAVAQPADQGGAAGPPAAQAPAPAMQQGNAAGGAAPQGGARPPQHLLKLSPDELRERALEAWHGVQGMNTIVEGAAGGDNPEQNLINIIMGSPTWSRKYLIIYQMIDKKEDVLMGKKVILSMIPVENIIHPQMCIDKAMRATPSIGGQMFEMIDDLGYELCTHLRAPTGESGPATGESGPVVGESSANDLFSSVLEQTKGSIENKMGDCGWGVDTYLATLPRDPFGPRKSLGKLDSAYLIILATIPDGKTHWDPDCRPSLSMRFSRNFSLAEGAPDDSPQKQEYLRMHQLIDYGGRGPPGYRMEVPENFDASKNNGFQVVRFSFKNTASSSVDFGANHFYDNLMESINSPTPEEKAMEDLRERYR